jgi:mannose-6-phosphate isomerase
MMELMEPTDWVVRCETVTAGVELTPDQCFMGLDLERCLDIFDYRAYSDEAVHHQFQQTPRSIHAEADFREEELIAAAHHEFFRLHRVRGRGAAHWPGGELMLLILTLGKGTLRSTPGAGEMAQAGQTWLLPGAATTWEWTDTEGDWEILIARLPLPVAARTPQRSGT